MTTPTATIDHFLTLCRYTTIDRHHGDEQI